MSRHPHLGVRKSKPRMPKAEPNGEPTSKEEIAKLSEEYLRARNSQMASKAAVAEMELARRRGELISKEWAFASLSYLLVCLRREVLSVPGAWAPRLAGLTVEEVTARLREMTHAWLTAVANLPERVTDPDWLKTVATEEEQAAGVRQQTPPEIKREQARAKVRRQKKTEVMRKARAAGRA